MSYGNFGLFILWEAHREQHDTTHDDIPSGTGSTLAVPGHVVFALERDPPGLCGPHSPPTSSWTVS